jgi:hypothetical protein
MGYRAKAKSSRAEYAISPSVSRVVQIGSRGRCTSGNVTEVKNDIWVPAVAAWYGGIPLECDGRALDEEQDGYDEHDRNQNHYRPIQDDCQPLRGVEQSYEQSHDRELWEGERPEANGLEDD